jgi:hypothetical protein
MGRSKAWSRRLKNPVAPPPGCRLLCRLDHHRMRPSLDRGRLGELGACRSEKKVQQRGFYLRSHSAASAGRPPSHRGRLIDTAKPAAPNAARSWPTRVKADSRPKNVCRTSAVTDAASAIAVSAPMTSNSDHSAERLVALIDHNNCDEPNKFPFLSGSCESWAHRGAYRAVPRRAD